MNEFYKVFLIVTCVFFWMEFILDNFPPACKNENFTVVSGRQYICVSAIPFWEQHK